MPYGKSMAKSVARTMRAGTDRRITATKKIQRAARARIVAKARKAPVRQVAKNTLAIRKLSEYAWGPMQRNQGMSDICYPLADHPVIFHLNNLFLDGAHGPQLYMINGTQAQNVGVFHKFPDNSPSGFVNEDMDGSLPNGPYLKYLGTRLRFEFSGLINNTYVRVQIVRQKKLAGGFYQQSNGTNYLPSCGHAFKRLAGPMAENRIDKRVFEVLHDKTAYINSKGRTSVTDVAAGHQYTSEPTTTGKKYIAINFRPNKVQKQLQSAVNQESGVEDLGENVTNVHPNVNIDKASSWSYDNIHPLANYFCIISCTDPQNITAIDGSSIATRILRENFWRDKRA